MINIQNIDDNDCFKWSLVRYLNPADHNPARITKAVKDFAKMLDFNDIKFPVTVIDMYKIDIKFVYQPTLDTLDLSWKSKELYTSKLNPLYTSFLHSKRLSRYRMRIKFYRDPLAVEQSNYLSKIENIYISVLRIAYFEQLV